MLAVKITKVEKVENGLYKAIGHLITKWNINTLEEATGETKEKAMENLYWILNLNAGGI
jgi:hypothetical protein